MCDVTGTRLVIAVALLLQTVSGLNFEVQLKSLDVKLLPNQPIGDDTISLRARQDSEQQGKEEIVLNLLGDTTSGVKDEQKDSELVRLRASDSEMECRFPYPARKQFNAVLSNMMNELTKVFVQANDWLKEKITRRSNKLTNAEVIRRALDSRFKVAHQRRRDFFDVIYRNMVEEYKRFYNSTAVSAGHIRRDACQHQEEAKQLWQDLLDRSVITLKGAMRRCIAEYLQDQKIHPASKLGLQVHQYLLVELGKVKSSQMKVLCDKFQLCYNELLQQFRFKSMID